MSKFKKDDIIRYNHNNVIYYIRITEPGVITNSYFQGVIVQTPDTTWTPDEALKDPEKVLMFSGSDSWFTVIDLQDIPRDPYIVFNEALDTLERQL